ncbi:NAD-dependent epimerase/dehydratase family protein [Candidatus Pacearchaeota archaeon]|nr:NAD-dependent epimerase/dehydratase family protein [Candidatus Pacearchaeota archaeon]
MQFMNRILITGGAGFVGSNLAINLKNDFSSSEIIALDNLKRRGSEINLMRLNKGGVNFVHGDIRNKEDLEAVGAVDLIVDCSAEPSVLAGIKESPEYVVSTNLGGTLNTLEMARKNESSIIFLSTSRVYPIKTLRGIKCSETESRFEILEKQLLTGVSSKGITENFPIEGVRSLYGATKLCSEIMMQEYLETYDLKGVINRCGVITGPWQMGKVDQGVIALWIARHLYGGKLKYIGYGGSGKQVRDALHIDDLYRLIKIQIEDLKRHNKEIYNVGGGRDVSISLLELTQLCQKITGNTIKIDPVNEERIFDVPVYITDNSKVQKATGWKPNKSIEEIITDVSKWIIANKELLEPVLN